MDAQAINTIVYNYKKGNINFMEASFGLVMLGLKPNEIKLLLIKDEKQTTKET